MWNKIISIIEINPVIKENSLKSGLFTNLQLVIIIPRVDTKINNVNVIKATKLMVKNLSTIGFNLVPKVASIVTPPSKLLLILK